MVEENVLHLNNTRKERNSKKGEKNEGNPGRMDKANEQTLK